MSDLLMPETTTAALKRVLPDIDLILEEVSNALTESESRRYSISRAVDRTQSLLTALLRAERLDAKGDR